MMSSFSYTSTKPNQPSTGRITKNKELSGSQDNSRPTRHEIFDIGS